MAVQRHADDTAALRCRGGSVASASGLSAGMERASGTLALGRGHQQVPGRRPHRETGSPVGTWVDVPGGGPRTPPQRGHHGEGPPLTGGDFVARGRPRAVSAGLKDWEKRLIISDRAHLGESQALPAHL